MESLESRWVMADVGGAIAGNTVWDLAGSPYNVLSDVTIGNGATLTIQPGVAVRFNTNTGISLSGSGRLVAEGSPFNRITFGPTVAGQNWDGLTFTGSQATPALADNRITYADFTRGDGQGEAIEVDYARLFLDNVTWTGTNNTVLELFHPSLIVRNSSFPTSDGGEIIHGEYISGNEYLIIEGNVFANSNNGGDVIDILGADRPGPVMQILNNVFLGGGDDGLDMDGTDAHIEGNLFMNFHLNTGRDTTSNAIATGLPQSGESNRTQVTIVRNIFVDNDHHILLKEDAFGTIENNVFLDADLAAIQFHELNGTAVGGPALGADLVGNIFWGNASLFKNLIKNATFQTQLTVNRSLLPNELQTYSDGSTALAHSFGTGNISGNPLFVDQAGGNYRLQSGSPAKGTGPNGLDMGAYVPAGPTITGVPTSPSTTGDLQFTVAGPGITHYRYRLNGGAYGPITPVATPITLTGLANTDYTIDVLGMNDAGEWFAGQTPAYRENHAEIIAPTRTRTGEALPMIVRVRDSHGQVNSLLSTPASLNNAAHLGGADFRVKKGTGSLAPTVTATSDFTLAMGGSLATGGGSRAVDVLDASYPVVTHSGTLSGNTVWDNTAEHRITGTLTIPAGSSLTIGAGTRVMLGDRVNLIVEGNITVNGTAADPVMFNAINPAQDWGGIEVRGAGNRGEFHYTFMTQGGADTTRNFGHSNSQALLRTNAATIDCDNCYIINNTGKALAAENNPRLDFDWGVISNNDTGGEIRNVAGSITNTWIKDMPSDDGVFANDDNDAMYLLNDHSSGEPIVIENTFVIDTKDDCFDHNGARLVLRSSWLQGCTHEGVASSDHNYATIIDTVAMGANQGFEAGYGSPTLTVDHSVAVRNNRETEPGDPSSQAEVTAGLRYGDGYNTSNGDYEGDLIATNTVVWDSEDNVRNWDGTGQVPGELDVSFSMTNDPEYDGTNNNFAGVPVFGPFMHLLRGSPGIHAGSDGQTVGRLFPPLTRTFSVNNTEAQLRISEVLALTNNGASSDLIELSNSGGAPADLSGMSITNDPAEPLKYTFGPGTTLGPGQSLVLFADLALGPPTEHHLGFELDAAGDEVLLYPPAPHGGVPFDSVTFGRQLNDRSLSRMSDGTWRLGQPTLGGANIAVPTGSATAMRLNEWLAAPGGAFPTDFVELYNSDALPVDFGGLHLTNNTGQPDLFTIRPLSFVAGNGLLVYVADGNTAAGFDHLNFQLDPAGGSIALTGVNPAATIDSITYAAQTAGVSQGRLPNGGATIGAIDPPTPGVNNPNPPQPDVENLILIDDVWSYFDEGTNLGTAWKEPGYIENGWGSGPAALYNDDNNIGGPKNTVLRLDADGDGDNTITFYFRTHFTLTSDPADIQLQLRRLVDDGAVFYLNGHEVHRYNMPAAPAVINFDTVASSTQEASALSGVIVLPKQHLVQGDNVLAVEVHQRDAGSSDIVFAATLDAVEINDSTPPSAPSNLAGTVASSNLVNLTWAAATDAESGVQFYNVYRGGTLIGTSIVTTFADTTVAAGQTYQYEVAAVNSANLEGPRSTAASVTVETVLSFQNGVFPTPAYTGTTDTWLEQENPTAIHGNDTTINLDIRRTDSNANTAAWALIEFDVSAIPPGSVVQSAVLTLNITNTSSATFGVYASLREWSEAAANWNVYAPGQSWQPPGGAGPNDRGTTVLGTFNPSAQGPLSMTLSAEGRALVESWINDPNDNHGVMLHGSGTDFDGTQFTSSESTNTANRPRLTVAYSTGDTTPPVIIARQTALDIAPQRVEFIFSEDVSVDAADLVLVNNTTAQTISPGQMQVTFNTVTNAARWTFPGLPGGVLPSGQYTATLTTSSVTDTAGNPTTPNGLETLSFQWLQGDTNQDGTIDAADIDRLYDIFTASNTSPVVDLDGDGNVDQQDVDRLVNFIIGTRYGDADLDHDVDRTDLLTLVSNYGGSGGWATGDFTGDNTVGLADLARQQQNFGLASAPSPTAASAILVGHASQAESTKFRALRRSSRGQQPSVPDPTPLSPAAVDSTMAQAEAGTHMPFSKLRARRHFRSDRS